MCVKGYCCAMSLIYWPEIIWIRGMENYLHVHVHVYVTRSNIHRVKSGNHRHVGIGKSFDWKTREQFSFWLFLFFRFFLRKSITCSKRDLSFWYIFILLVALVIPTGLRHFLFYHLWHRKWKVQADTRMILRLDLCDSINMCLV